MAEKIFDNKANGKPFATNHVRADEYPSSHLEGDRASSIQGVLTNLRRAVRATPGEIAGALFLLVMATSLVAVIARKSITNDEIVMIPAAYNHVVAGKSEALREHPPLSKFLAALPMLFIQPNEPTPRPVDAPPLANEDKWVDQARFWEANPAAFESLSFWPRVPMIFLTIVLGVLIFTFARDLFGARAAVLSVALFSVEPTILAHGRVVQTDVPAAFGFLFVSYMLFRYVNHSTYKRAAWLGVAAGFALLAKFSMLLIGPALALFFLGLLWRSRRRGVTTAALLAHAGIVFLIAALLIQAAYYFHNQGPVESDVLWVKKSFPVNHAVVLPTISALAYALPIDFVLGAFWQVWHNNYGHPAALLGSYSRKGWWYYFPVAFALKTTLPFLILSVASLAWGVSKWIKDRDRRFLWLLVPFVIYTIFVLFSHINIGVRYYLPAYPFLFILCGALFDQLFNVGRARWMSILFATAMLCWIGVEALRAYPNHMSYMNQLASSHPRWWYLSDSNVEWGDDCRELALYLRAHGEKRVQAAFLGDFLTLHHYGIEPVNIGTPEAGDPEPPRYVAIGASFLNGSTIPEDPVRWPNDTARVNAFDSFRQRKPEAVIGNSIYVYRVHE